MFSSKIQFLNDVSKDLNNGQFRNESFEEGGITNNFKFRQR